MRRQAGGRAGGQAPSDRRSWQVLFAATAMEPRESKLVRIVRNFVGSDVPIVPIARRFFNDATGTQPRESDMRKQM
jgi:hypothetical protein